MLATPAAAERVVTLQQGVLVDLQQQHAYLMAPQGGVIQLNIETGSVNWTSTAADRPVRLDGNTLLAQIDSQKPGTMELVSLGQSDGQAQHRQAVDLPDSVIPLIDERLARRFALRQSPDEPSQLLWRESHQLIRGAAMAGKSEARITVGMMNYRGKQLVATTQFNKTVFDQLWIRAAAVTPAPAGTPGKRRFLSVDQVHSLTSSRGQAASLGMHTPNTGSDEPAQRLSTYWWQVYDATGDTLGGFSSPVAFSPFVVSQDLLLHVIGPFSVRTPEGALEHQPLSLVATQISTGKIVWRKAIRDTRYRGPFPT